MRPVGASPHLAFTPPPGTVSSETSSTVTSQPLIATQSPDLERQRAASAEPAEPTGPRVAATSLAEQRLHGLVKSQVETSPPSPLVRRRSLDAASDGLSQRQPGYDAAPRKRQRVDAVVDPAEAATLRRIMLEANRYSLKPASDSHLEHVRRLQGCFARAAEGGMSALTMPTRLSVTPGSAPQSLPAKTESASQWLKRIDKPGSYLVLNGNNDEGYVKHVAEVMRDSQHTRLICSGFGGHGTTGRYPISINRTEGDRFRQILEAGGIDSARILVDPRSTNSGENAIYVGRILDEEKVLGRAVNRVIVAGTPAAVFRQTHTYAQQLRMSDAQPLEVESFPFSDAARYRELADHVAVLREFSTTLNYLCNTGYLPQNPDLYPKAFFQAAQQSFSSLAKGMRSQHPSVDKNVLHAFEHLSEVLSTRFPKGAMTTEDKDQAQVADRFMRSMFDALERTFPRRLT